MTEVATKVRREVDLGDGSGKQVFEADTADELLDKLTEAQLHATRKIREQAQHIQERDTKIQQIEAATEEPEVPADGFDKQGYFSALYEDPIKAQKLALEQLFGVPFEQIQATFGNAANAAEVVNVNGVNARFVQKHPELMQVTPEEDIHNSKIIEGICKENNWAWTDGHVEAAFLIAREQKKLKLPAATLPDAPQPTPPATLGSQGTGAPAVNEADLFKTMSMDQRREYLSQKAARLRGGQ